MSLTTLKMSSDNILAALPDELLGRILFSGYLEPSWHCHIGLILVNRKFLELGRRYIPFCISRERISIHPTTHAKIQLDTLGICKFASNLVYLDLSFCDNINYSSPELGSMVQGLNGTLRALSLRGSKVPDAFLVAVVSKLTNLRFLNVSQNLRVCKELVTDEGALHLANLKSLKWLNLSSTNITDQTVVALQQNLLFLEHFEVFGCTNLTDHSLQVMSRWKLHTLDISACRLMTTSGVALLSDPR